jgi:hypothetical protein
LKMFKIRTIKNRRKILKSIFKENKLILRRNKISVKM